MQEYYATVKGILLGDSGSGKTSLFERCTHNRFEVHHTKTIGVDVAFWVFDWEPQKPVRMQLWDTSGDQRFDGITQSYLRDIAFVVLVVDITRASSFNSIDKYIELVRTHCTNPFVEMVVLGNKADLQDQRALSREQARDFCHHRNLPYREVSAKQGTRVRGTFEQVCINALNSSMVWDNKLHGLHTGSLHALRMDPKGDEGIVIRERQSCVKCCLLQ